MDSCGIASGFANPASYVEVPRGYQGGQKGSEVLPETAPTYWKAGGTAKVGWGLSAQHGGGYSYRLCPKGSTLNEDCFQSNTFISMTDHMAISPFPPQPMWRQMAR